YGLHLNDGYGSLDDGLMVGSVNLPQTLELLYYLLRANYNEVIYFDTFPTHEDPVQECAHNIERVNRMVEVIGRLDDPALQNALSQQDGLRTTQLLWEAMFPA
ncbi:MAG: sugar phosphate isomerase/epimerase, partial [Anaerolineae bacterium]